MVEVEKQFDHFENSIASSEGNKPDTRKSGIMYFKYSDK
jgi:hypothetical protein